MPDLERWLCVALALGVLLGGGAVWRVRSGHGHVLFLAALLLLGAANLVAACYRAEMLVPLGFAAAGLLAAYLWERPAPRRQPS